jgi:hypothetical protein
MQKPHGIMQEIAYKLGVKHLPDNPFTGILLKMIQKPIQLTWLLLIACDRLLRICTCDGTD